MTHPMLDPIFTASADDTGPETPDTYLGHCWKCGQAVYRNDEDGESTCPQHDGAPVVPLEAFERHQVVLAELAHAQVVIAGKLLGEGVTVTKTHPEIRRIDVVLGRTG